MQSLEMAALLRGYYRPTGIKVSEKLAASVAMRQISVYLI